ncbi:hypothetical protein B0H14DRAFT_2572887 [Mycena olivaceomarginata]|nr:hypothetical protein B0H14DRAFT_2572887 [Mycena olivaceomarginata]
MSGENSGISGQTSPFIQRRGETPTRGDARGNVLFSADAMNILRKMELDRREQNKKRGDRREAWEENVSDDEADELSPFLMVVCAWGRRRYTGISNKPNCQRRVVGGNQGNSQYALNGFGRNLSRMVAQTCRKSVNPPAGLRMGQAEAYGDFKLAQLGSGQRRVVGGNQGSSQYALDGFGQNIFQMVARTHRKGVTPPIGLRMRQAEVYGCFKQARLGG